MNTLRYSWLGLIIVVILAVLGLKEYPNLVSYDYYYKDLTVKLHLQGASLDDNGKRDNIIQAMKSGLESSLEKYTHEIVGDPKVKVKPKDVKLTFTVKMKNYSNCYFYLLHHRKLEQVLFKELTPEYIHEFKRDWRRTYLTQEGAFNAQELKEIGSYSADLSCTI